MCCRFCLISEHLVEFNQLAIETAKGSHDMINRVMTKDNIGLAALLETKGDIWENGKWKTFHVNFLLNDIALCH
jgi:CCR4-NOT transcription complex subunit 6